MLSAVESVIEDILLWLQSHPIDQLPRCNGMVMFLCSDEIKYLLRREHFDEGVSIVKDLMFLAQSKHKVDVRGGMEKLRKRKVK
jgi:hypothetical protein